MQHSWKDRHILVTGGTGFIGSFLVEYLLDHGAKVRVPVRSENYRALSERRSEIDWMEGDLRDPLYCASLVSGVNEVFHMASCRRNVTLHRTKCSDVLNENVRMTLALIEGLKERDPIPVTFFSTANIPPSMDPVALSQSESVDGYVLGKALCETLWFTAAKQRQFPLLILRPVGVYGPRDTFAEDGNVIPALMMKARDHDVLEVWGTGDEERSFLYVEDLIRAIDRLCSAGVTGIQYVTSNDVVTVRELAEGICALVKPGMSVTFDPEKSLRPRTIPMLKPHPTLASLEWTGLQEGLTQTFHAWNNVPVAV